MRLLWGDQSKTTRALAQSKHHPNVERDESISFLTSSIKAGFRINHMSGCQIKECGEPLMNSVSYKSCA